MNNKRKMKKKKKKNQNTSSSQKSLRGIFKIWLESVLVGLYIFSSKN
jgi:hypothetical protein